MISVVIPAYNEEAILKDNMNTLIEFLDKSFNGDYELVLVNDGSKDSTGVIMKTLEKEHEGKVVCAGYDINRGKGGAVKEGVLHSKGDIVLYTDSDLAYGCEIIKSFYDALINSDFSAAIGSRRLGEDGYHEYTFLRKVMSWGYLMVLKVFAGFSYSDSQCGIKAFKGDKAREIFALTETNGFAFDLEVLMIARKMRLNISEIPVKIINHRDSKINPVKDSVKMLLDIFKIKRRVNRNFR